MGLFSSKKLSLPDAPKLFIDPYVGLSEAALYGQGAALTTPNVNDLPSVLRESALINPEVTQLALQGLRSATSGDLRDSRQSIINTLEANNQLTGSTTASSLQSLESDYLSSLTAAGAEAAIADVNRALENRIRIYSMGLGAYGQAGELGLQNQGQVNNFNLSNYENLVAKTLGEQKSGSGGIFGGIMGGLGGAIGGLALAPFTGGASLAPALLGGLGGAVAGYAGPSGTGGSLLTAGAGLAGNRMQTESINDVLKKKSGSNSFWSSLYGGLN